MCYTYNVPIFKDRKMRKIEDMKKCAFTLAEVLITLSILGIVAAISIPNIIQNYQKQATVSRLKMAYSILDRLTQQSYIENGYPPLNSAVDKNIFDTYFGKYLNIAKECGLYNKTYWKMNMDSGCFKSGTFSEPGVTGNNKDGNGEERKKDTFVNLDGSNYDQGGYGPSSYYMVLLKNGMGLGVSLNHAPQNGFSMVVDIDGPNRGDSKLGQDVFQFTYYFNNLSPSRQYKNNKCPNIGLLPGAWKPEDMNESCQPVKGAVSPREYLKERCKEGGTNYVAFPNGSGCSGLIILDGWKISSDYPWTYAHKK